MLQYYAHNQLVEGKTGKEVWDIGTTSLCGKVPGGGFVRRGVLTDVPLSTGGVLMELKAEEGSPRWGLVAVVVGDSKIYHYSPKAKKGLRVVDITANSRLHARDERGPLYLCSLTEPTSHDGGRWACLWCLPVGMDAQILEGVSDRTWRKANPTCATFRCTTSRASRVISSSSSHGE